MFSSFSYNHMLPPLPNKKTLALSKLKVFEDDKLSPGFYVSAF